jgi:hypothetical protein
MVVIVVCVALVIDLGHVHNVKAELQRAVDAAALAGGRYLPDQTNVTSVALAAAGNNTVDGALFSDHLTNQSSVTAINVLLGTWDKDNLTGNAGDRFTPTVVGPDAVYVRASRNVDHVFFFFTDSTPVVADAIAQSEPINPILPLTMVSCIPLDAIQQNPGSTPGEDVCDIKYYGFTNDTDDTAAWTGLTLDPNANDIGSLLAGAEGRQLFEQSVFGEGGAPASANSGIENTDPTTPGVICDPDDLVINCGLGRVVPGENLSEPDDFSGPADALADPPQNIERNSSGVFESPNDFNPLTAYNINDILPRWYNTNSNGTFQTDDHFTRVWSLDGFLVPPIVGTEGPNGEIETFTEYQTRLEALYNGTYDLTNYPFDPVLFQPDGNVNRLIDDGPPQSVKSAVADHFGVATGDVDYWPDLGNLMAYAGYPKVGVTNGNAATLLGAFLDNAEVSDGSALMCSPNDELTPYDTLRIQVPVIFAGYCESWKALSNASSQHNLVYVGLADFYITRMWKNPDDYACISNWVSVNGTSCAGNSFDPPLVSGEYQEVNDNGKGMEGMITVPQINSASAASTAKVYLVE